MTKIYRKGAEKGALFCYNDGSVERRFMEKKENQVEGTA